MQGYILTTCDTEKVKLSLNSIFILFRELLDRGANPQWESSEVVLKKILIKSIPYEVKFIKIKYSQDFTFSLAFF
jgi:hypothetical protein